MTDLEWSKWKRTKHLRFVEEVEPAGDNTSRLVRILQQMWRRKTLFKQYGDYEIQELWLDVGDEPNG